MTTATRKPAFQLDADQQHDLRCAASFIREHLAIDDPQYRLAERLGEIGSYALLSYDYPAIGRLQATVELIEVHDPGNDLAERIDNIADMIIGCRRR